MGDPKKDEGGVFRIQTQTWFYLFNHDDQHIEFYPQGLKGTR